MAGNATAPATSTTHEPYLALRQTVLGICVLYAVLTLLSSTLSLATGGTTETHVHLLLRFGVTTIGVSAFYVYGLLRRRLPTVPSGAVGLATYVIAVVVAMAGAWLYGRVDTLHPDAYRDLFLNFTAVGVGLSVVWAALTVWRRRRQVGRASAT